ncbi:sodium:solute symporter [candidate division KSB1 bacterium]
MENLLIPFIVLIIYGGVLVFNGYMGWRFSQAKMVDYFLAGRTQGWIVNSLTLMATFFSSFAILGASGMLYRHGIGFVLFSLNVPIAGALIYIFGRPLWRLGKRFDFVTPGDLMAHFFKSDVLRILYVLVGLVYVIPYIVIQIKAGGYIFSVITGGIVSFNQGAYILSGVAVVYIIAGGLRSVAWNDVFNGALLLMGMIAGGVVTIVALGGIKKLFTSALAVNPDFLTVPGPEGYWAIPMLFTYILVGSLGTMVAPAQWMRYYAARSPDVLRRSAIVFSTLLTCGYLFGVSFVGLGGRVLLPEIDPDAVFLQVITTYLPLAFASTVAIAIIAAALSTANANLHALSAILTRDIYTRFIRRGASDKEGIFVGRIIIFMATIVALWLALTMPGMIVPIGFISMAATMQLLPPVAALLWWPRVTKAGAITGILAGLIVLFIARSSPLGIHFGFWGVMVNATVMMLVSLLTKPRDEELLQQFGWTALEEVETETGGTG